MIIRMQRIAVTLRVILWWFLGGRIGAGEATEWLLDAIICIVTSQVLELYIALYVRGITLEEWVTKRRFGVFNRRRMSLKYNCIKYHKDDVKLCSFDEYEAG